MQQFMRGTNYSHRWKPLKELCCHRYQPEYTKWDRQLVTENKLLTLSFSGCAIFQQKKIGKGGQGNVSKISKDELANLIHSKQKKPMEL